MENFKKKKTEKKRKKINDYISQETQTKQNTLLSPLVSHLTRFSEDTNTYLSLFHLQVSYDL